jgi:hypothetical protein
MPNILQIGLTGLITISSLSPVTVDNNKLIALAEPTPVVLETTVEATETEGGPNAISMDKKHTFFDQNRIFSSHCTDEHMYPIIYSSFRSRSKY